MATVTASLERSLQNCSLNQTTSRNRREGGGGISKSSTCDSSDIINHHHQHHDDDDDDDDDYKHEEISHSNAASSSDDNSTLIELNSHVSLPYHWEQCLDLKTGELYYINWRTGMKAKEDPRTTATGYNGDYYSEEEDDSEKESEEGDDSEGSSTESSCWSSQERLRTSVKKGMQQAQVRQEQVLVVAGCKSCLMYHMLPKHVHICPKCSGQLLHFAANNNNSSP